MSGRRGEGGFRSLQESIDTTTSGGKLIFHVFGALAEFERDLIRDRVKAGIAQARKDGRPHGRPPTVAKHATEVRKLSQKGVSKREIARRMGISRASVRHLLEDGNA